MLKIEHLRTPSYFNEIDTCILSVLLKRHGIDMEALVIGKDINNKHWVDIYYNNHERLPYVMGKVFRDIRKNGIRGYCEQNI